MRPRPLDALRRVSERSLTLLLSRLELATLELGLTRDRLVRWLALLLASALVFQLALLAASAAVIVALWDRFGPLTLVACALVYGAVGVAVLVRLRREIATAPPLLSKTLAELAKDRDALFGEVSTASAAPSASDADAPAAREDAP